MTVKCCIAALLVGVVVSTADADISIEWVEVDNSSVLSGYRTFDLYSTSDFGWSGSALLFVLDTGSFFQHPLGDASKPHPFFTALYPELVYDTYLCAGENPIRLIGQAGDVGGDSLQFDEVELDVSWSEQTIPVPLPNGRLQMARITFSDDASGAWRLAIAASEPTGLEEFSGTVADIIPEPTSLTLLTLAGGLMFLRR